ncbi:MAG TPA: hypothetical protein DEB40_10985 [Elusimicrobia bacterium]|nr:hypothetical protein [Elusimicrobiota bacterium]HBT62255.1 hypothetical protein [Elusimicrobiota bacterium]
MNLGLIAASAAFLLPAAARGQAIALRGRTPAGNVSAAAGASALGPGLDFSFTHARMINGYKEVERRHNAAVDAVLVVPAAERNFKNTVRALERAHESYNDAVLPWIMMKDVSPDPRVRRAAKALERRSARHFDDLNYREDIYQAVLRAAQAEDRLRGENKKLLEDVLRDYRARGMGLPIEQRVNLKAINDRLSELSQAFVDNISKFEESQAPVGSALLARAGNSPAGRQPQPGRPSRPEEINPPILREILALRQEQSRILGYKNFAQYRLARNMARTPENAAAFLSELKTELQSPGRARAQAPQNGQSVYQRLRPYFPVATVLKGTFEIFHEILGIDFKELPAQAWHPDVRFFEVSDAATGRAIGSFYLDLFDRPGKVGDGWADALRKGHASGAGGYQNPINLVVAKFKKSSVDPNVWLGPEEVERIFHEFGHLMHGLLSRTRYSRYDSWSVPVDFREIPSMLWGNAVWRPEIVARISGHDQDPSRKLPPELLREQLAAQSAASADYLMYHSALAAMDLAFHTLESPLDVGQAAARVFAEWVGYFPKAVIGDFDHIVSGYEAGYYGYPWAYVRSVDVLSRFLAEGILNPKVGMEYRRKVLEPGASKDPWQMLRDFLGRMPGMDAFRRSLAPPPEPAAAS